MIGHEEIKNLVTEWNIREDVIEKDYVIGWVLWGIGQDNDLKDKWIFKGGTCLKKCYLETYRFSEDLDFTLLPDAPISPDDVLSILNRILERVAEESGINFSVKPPQLKQQKDFPLYTEGRIYYQGPRNAPTPSRIKLDLSAAEKVIRPPVLRQIAHNAYSDKLPEPAQVLCYSLEEIFAEKIRAMGERGFPRDLYDIVFLFRNGYFQSNPELIKSVLVSKCESKNVPPPTLERIKNFPSLNELRTEWSNMLAHQLPKLPEFEEFFNELPKLFDWLERKYTPKTLQTIPAGRNEEIGWRPPIGAFSWNLGIPLESIRFAAVNHLCIALGYKGTIRIVEPYSLRRTKENNLLLYAIKVDTRELRSYRVDRIKSIEVTDKAFQPVYQIEFSPLGDIYAPPTHREATLKYPSFREKSYKTSYGPKYIFECSICGKRFKRSKYDSILKPHKDKSGRDCFGRVGIFIETKYD